MKAKVLLINLAILLGLFIIIEITARLIMAGNAPFSERVKGNIAYSPSAYSMRWMNSDQEILHIENNEANSEKVKYSISERGYRDGMDLREKKAGELRIAILGGSHVFDAFSYDFQSNYSFSKLLENKLDEAGFSSNVINAGIPGANTCDFVTQVMFELSAYDLDYLIFNSAWNDIKWISKARKERQIIRFLPAAMRGNPFVEKVNNLDRLFGWSVVYRKVRDLYWKKKFNIDHNGMVEGLSTKEKIESNPALGFEQYAINLESSILIAKSLGIKPIIAIEERLVSHDNSEKDKAIIQYGMMNLSSHSELADYFESIDSICLALAIKHQTPFFDANKEMVGNSEYFIDHIHTSPSGSEKIAQKYFEEFEKLLVISDSLDTSDL